MARLMGRDAGESFHIKRRQVAFECPCTMKSRYCLLGVPGWPGMSSL
jgi:hypothetical protein